MSRPRVLTPAVAGSWYPAEPGVLARLVDDLLAPPDVAGANPAARALVAPHAGFAYSGRVAGLGFRELPPEAGPVVLIGPSHHAAFEGAVVPEASIYRTPLGDVAIDVDRAVGIAASPAVSRDDAPFRPEHCLEAELPFLQRRLRPGFRVVPVLVGSVGEPSVRDAVVDAIARVIDDRALLVVSSDFTHYGRRFGYVPFRERIAERIRRLDLDAIERITSRDAVGFREYVQRTGVTICGHAAIDLLLGLLPHETSGILVAYDTSGRMTGDVEHSVSYASVVFR